MCLHCLMFVGFELLQQFINEVRTHCNKRARKHFYDLKQEHIIPKCEVVSVLKIGYFNACTTNPMKAQTVEHPSHDANPDCEACSPVITYVSRVDCFWDDVLALNKIMDKNWNVPCAQIFLRRSSDQIPFTFNLNISPGQLPAVHGLQQIIEWSYLEQWFGRSLWWLLWILTSSPVWNSQPIDQTNCSISKNLPSLRGSR